MSGAPTEVPNEQLKELGLQLRRREDSPGAS